MISYKDQTIQQYLEKLAAREPVPGGGSAAAVSAALGAALMGMSARYSLGKGKPPGVEQAIQDIISLTDAARDKFIDLAGRDAQAYLDVVDTRKAGDKTAHEQAKAQAILVPQDIIKLCKECLEFTPFLHLQGNPHLLSDVKAAETFLKAGIDAAKHMQEANV